MSRRSVRQITARLPQFDGRAYAAVGWRGGEEIMMSPDGRPIIDRLPAEEGL